MSQPNATMERSTMTENTQYVALPISGVSVQTTDDTLLEFTMDDSRTIKVLVDTAPGQPFYKKAPGFARTTGGVSNVYYVVPVSRAWINGEPSSRVIAIAYSDIARSLIPLYPAVDTLRNHSNSKDKHSEVLYRAVDPITQKTVRSMNVVNVAVVMPQTVAD